jgi:hypothetical protein
MRVRSPVQRLRPIHFARSLPQAFATSSTTNEVIGALPVGRRLDVRFLSHHRSLRAEWSESLLKRVQGVVERMARRLKRVCKSPPTARRPLLPVLSAECPHSPSARLPSNKTEGVGCAIGANAEVSEVGAAVVVIWRFHVLAILNVDVITTSAGNGLPNKCRGPWIDSENRAVSWRHLLRSSEGNRRWSLRVATRNATRQYQSTADKQSTAPRVSHMASIQWFRSLYRSIVDCKATRLSTDWESSRKVTYAPTRHQP